MERMIKSKSKNERYRPEGGIYEVIFGYHPRTVVYPKTDLHIHKLFAICFPDRIM